MPYLNRRFQPLCLQNAALIGDNHCDCTACLKIWKIVLYKNFFRRHKSSVKRHYLIITSHHQSFGFLWRCDKEKILFRILILQLKRASEQVILLQSVRVSFMVQFSIAVRKPHRQSFKTSTNSKHCSFYSLNINIIIKYHCRIRIHWVCRR